MGYRKSTTKRLTSTYVTRRGDGKYEARVVDARTKREGKASRIVMMEAIAASRKKIS